jgi:hypothetical protein
VGGFSPAERSELRRLVRGLSVRDRCDARRTVQLLIPRRDLPL